MTPFTAYTTYRAERAQSDRERRLADARAGELAADFSRARSLLARPVRKLRCLKAFFPKSGAGTCSPGPLSAPNS
ncbi:MAG TPA: hypothetical protein VEJ84_08480 [Acidimicrobiales bacterium]|nr:hypothetical protein [Acidimicrobiales bacterium]